MFKVTSLILLSFLLTMSALAVTAQAETIEVAPDYTVPIECDFSGHIELTEMRSIVCDRDITFAPGTVIVTNGNYLDIRAVGNIDFGGLQIVSFLEDGQSVNADASEVYISGQTAIGSVSIRNLGRTEFALGGNITIDFLTVDCSYAQDLETSDDSTILDPLANLAPGETLQAHCAGR